MRAVVAVEPEQSARSAPATPTRVVVGAILAGAAGTWLGSLALRGFLTMLVWNVVEDAEPEEVGAVALAVWVVGLFGWWAARYLGGARPAWWLGLLVAVVAVARQAFPGEIASPALSFAALVVWMWWAPAYLRELGRRELSALAAAAIVLGLCLQVAAQSAMHGMDLNMLVGPGSGLAALVLAGAFVAGLHFVLAAPEKDAAEMPRWGAFALWPYLFLQIELAANLGRLGLTSGWELAPTALVVEAGLMAGLLLLRWSPPFALGLALGVVSVALLVAAPALKGAAVLAVIPLQAGLVLALGAAFAPARGGLYRLFVAGALVYFALTFIYYQQDVLPALWAVAGAMVIAASLRAVRPAPSDMRLAGAAGLAAVVGVAASLVPYPAPALPAPSEELRVLSLNAHQHLDLWSVPNAQGIADLIEAQAPDLVALQEINRGWSISGGVDGVAWLRWRFPGYAVLFGPQHGDTFGNVVMSRYPVRDAGWVPLFLGRGEPPRAFAWATVGAPGGDVLLVSVHAASSAAGPERDGRPPHTEELLRFWAGRPRTLIAGDLNDRPGSEAINRMFAGGMQEALTLRAPGRNLTQPALAPEKQIDYIFASPDWEITAAEVLLTGASDHAPVLAKVRARRS
jgi:endonuclease/exonuclease/phosphatase family metal-dependent hydrolase